MLTAYVAFFSAVLVFANNIFKLISWAFRLPNHLHRHYIHRSQVLSGQKSYLFSLTLHLDLISNISFFIVKVTFPPPKNIFAAIILSGPRSSEKNIFTSPRSTRRKKLCSLASGPGLHIYHIYVIYSLVPGPQKKRNKIPLPGPRPMSPYLLYISCIHRSQVLSGPSFQVHGKDAIANSVHHLPLH